MSENGLKDNLMFLNGLITRSDKSKESDYKLDELRTAFTLFNNETFPQCKEIFNLVGNKGQEHDKWFEYATTTKNGLNLDFVKNKGRALYSFNNDIDIFQNASIVISDRKFFQVELKFGINGSVVACEAQESKAIPLETPESLVLPISNSGFLPGGSPLGLIKMIAEEIDRVQEELEMLPSLR